jgi:acetyl esterase
VPVAAEIQPLLDQLNAVEIDMAQLTPEALRGGLDALWASWAGDPPAVEANDCRIPGAAGEIPVRIYHPGGEPVATIVFFHGGGFTIGTLDAYDATCRYLCDRTASVVVSVDYRLAPEHPFPAGPDDCYAALVWTADHAAEIGGDASRLVVVGDSGGGNLAAVTALRARDLGTPRLAAQVLVYPCFDWTCSTRSQEENAKGYLLTRDQMLWFYGHYAPDRTSPYADPRLAADLSGSAPALVITAEYDPLRDEGEEYAALLEKAGVPVVTSRYDGMIHGFLSMFAITPRAAEAHTEIAHFLFGHFRAP